MKHWYLFSFYTVSILFVLISAYMGIIPTEIGIVPMYDSIGHFVLYGVWFYLLHRALNKKIFIVLKFAIPVAFLILLPIVTLEEFAQKFASTRTFSLIDLLWGFAGMYLFWFLTRRKETT
jgi:polysaccharide biosynthesis protein VpsQ